MDERVSRWWSPWWSTTAALVSMTLTLWSVTPPGVYFSMLMLAYGCWLVVGLVWLTTVGGAVITLPRPRLRRSARLWPFLLAPVVLVATYGVLHTGVVPRAVWSTHRSSFEALVAESDERTVDRRVGLFTVDVDVDRLNGCTLLRVQDAGLLAATGWAHCPDRVPVDARGDGYKYTPYDGPWYEFRFEW